MTKILYEVLGVNENATDTELRKAYHKKVNIYAKGN